MKYIFLSPGNEEGETKPVSFIIPIRRTSDKFLVGFGNQIARISWDGSANRVEDFQVMFTLGHQNLSYGKVTPGGVLLVGKIVTNLFQNLLVTP